MTKKIPKCPLSRQRRKWFGFGKEYTEGHVWIVIYDGITGSRRHRGLDGECHYRDTCIKCGIEVRHPVPKKPNEGVVIELEETE